MPSHFFLGLMATPDLPAAVPQLQGFLAYDTTLDTLTFCTGAAWLPPPTADSLETDLVHLATLGHLYLGAFPTASLPTPTADLKAHLAYDTTVLALKYCTGTAWELVAE